MHPSSLTFSSMSLRGADGVLTKELRDELVLRSSVSRASLIPLLTELLSSQLKEKGGDREMNIAVMEISVI